MKTLISTAVAVLLTASSTNMALADSIDLKSCQTNVQVQLAAFKESDNHSHLINAYRVAFLSQIKPDTTNSTEAMFALKLQVLQECYRARDFDYDLKADHGITTVVCPPLDSGQMVVPGMDPKLITNVVARQTYEAAIEENNRRRGKFQREQELQRTIDHCVRLIKAEATGRPKESPTSRQLIELVNKTVTEQGLKETLLK